MRVLVLGAGGPAGHNTLHALAAARHHVVAADPNPLHLPLLPARRELSPDHTDKGWLEWVNRCIGTYGIELVIPQPDPLVLHVAQLQDHIEAEVVLPDVGTILMCQDKFETGWRWADRGLRQPIVKLDHDEALDDAGDTLGWPLWIRATKGAGAQCATMAKDHCVADSWLDYWHSRGTTHDFVAEEYLPGRDWAWCGVYNHGDLLTSFLRERVEYLYPNVAPSGRTGTPTVARVAHDDRICDIAEFAVEVIDRDWHGIACVDLREDAEGIARPTEINAGRTCTTVPLFHEVGVNVPDVLTWMAGAAIGPGQGDPLSSLPVRHAVPACFLHRHIDAGHVFACDCDTHDATCPPCWTGSVLSHA